MFLASRRRYRKKSRETVANIVTETSYLKSLLNRTEKKREETKRTGNFISWLVPVIDIKYIIGIHQAWRDSIELQYQWMNGKHNN